MQTLSESEIIRFRIPSDAKYVPTIRRAVQSIARCLGFPEDIAEDIEISIAEALANAVEHGSPDHKSEIVVICKVDEDNLTIDVRDGGLGFEPPCPEGPYDFLDERGRGLRLIYKLMDRVNIHRTTSGSRIRMVKQRRKANLSLC